MKRLLVIGILLALGGCGWCVYRAWWQVPTVPGPEDPGVLARSSGTVVYVPLLETEPEGIHVLDLPTLQKRVLQIDVSRWIVSGPDEQCRIAYFAKTAESSDHIQLTIYHLLEGRRRVLFRRVEPEEYGNVALSPRTGKVTFVASHRDVWMRDPDTLLYLGRLEVWDVETGEVRRWEQDVLVSLFQQRVAWLDDDTIVYAGLGPNDAWARERAGEVWRNWPEVPTVYVLDLRQGHARRLYPGEDPVVHPTERKVLVDIGGNCKMVDIETGEAEDMSEAMKRLGTHCSIMALLPEDQLLYIGAPTKGTKIKRRVGSTFRIWLYWPLKIGNWKEGKYYTLVPYLTAGLGYKGSYGPRRCVPEMGRVP